MGEEVSQGITRRDLLRRGAVLGGAVVWTTPVVQTLGMGRAFASTASPVETRISFIAMDVDCGGTVRFVKWNEGTGWEASPGDNNPNCKLGTSGVSSNGETLGIKIKIKSNGCAEVDLSASGCTFVKGVVFGGGPRTCTPFTEADLGNVCL